MYAIRSYYELSYVAMKFKKMCADIIQLKKKYDFKVVVGGNGAWELAKTVITSYSIHYTKLYEIQ